MKRWYLFCLNRQSLNRTMLGIAVTCLVGVSRAGLKEDVLAFTGTVPAKMVWVQAPKENAENHYNGKPNSILMCYGTAETAPRVLDPARGLHNLPFISRSGEYVFWFAYESAAFVVDWNGNNKRTILTKAADTAYLVVAVQWDENANKEYLYACTQAPSGSDDIWIAGQKLYQYDFKDGSINKATKKLVLDLTSPTWMGLIPNAGDRWCRILPMLVSGDGKYAAANQPWPNIWVSDLTGGTSNIEVSTGGEQACHPNMAPDNSHQVFHLNGGHNRFHFFTSPSAIPASTNTNDVWWIDVATKLPGIKAGWDLSAPRWSNNIQYFSVGAPLTGMTEATSTAQFYIAKFSNDFRTITGYCITPNSTTRDKVGDFWLENGVGPKKASVSKSSRSPGKSNALFVTHSGKAISFKAHDQIHAVICDAAGKTVSSYSGAGGSSWDIKNVKPGTYVLRAQSKVDQWSAKIAIGE